MISQINMFRGKDYASKEELWKKMEHHTYVITDVLANALVDRFQKSLCSP